VCQPYATCVQNGVVFGNGKAANAGGVAVSGLEMSQNRIGERWLFYCTLNYRSWPGQGGIMISSLPISTRQRAGSLLPCAALPHVVLPRLHMLLFLFTRAGLQWSREEVEAKLTDIMNTIYRTAKVSWFQGGPFKL